MVSLFSIERLLEFGGWDIAEVAVEVFRVVPVHPDKGRKFEVFDRLPWPGPGGASNEFVLVVAVHRLSQGLVMRIPDRSD